jgi:hypothetical protein
MDYQTNALYGDSAGAGTLYASDLNPGAYGPDDWTTVLTNGVSGAALYGLNGWITNQLQAGQIANQQAAGAITVKGIRNGVTVNGGLVPWLVVGLVAWAVFK